MGQYYREFLDTITEYITSLNEADKRIQPKYDDTMCPQLGNIPVIMDDGLVGWLVDEIGGVWSYRDATREEMVAYHG